MHKKLGTLLFPSAGHEMRDFGGIWNTGNTCYVKAVLQCLLLPGFLPALHCRDSWLAARLAAHVEPPRDVAASVETIDAADFAASAELEESMEAFRTDEACILRRLVAFSDIQQNLRARVDTTVAPETLVALYWNPVTGVGHSGSGPKTWFAVCQCQFPC
jgi:hypothetical protein